MSYTPYVRERIAVPVRVVLLLGIVACGGALPLVAQESAGDRWRLVYAVDSAGRRTEGEKATLLTAIRAGQPVRVGWTLGWRRADGVTGALEHVAQASFLTIHHDEAFAQLAPILGQTPSAREPVVALRPNGNRLWYALLDTTGKLTGYFTGDSTTQITRIATRWYVPGAAP
jgi:hypothetical protein